MHKTMLIVLGSLLSSGTAAAQDSPRTVTRGSEVRLYTSSAFAAGRLDVLTDTTIALVSNKTRRVFPRSSVLQFQVREARGWVDVPLAGLTLSPVPAARLGLNAGDRVRLRRGPRREEGTFVAQQAESIVLRSVHDSSEVRVALAVLDALDRYRGRRANTVLGLAIGFGAGAVAGAVVGAAATGACSSDELCSLVPFVTGALGAGVGGLAGALIGAVAKSDRWDAVPLDRFRFDVAALGQRRMAFRVALKF